jgi:hypothetical protein
MKPLKAKGAMPPSPDMCIAPPLILDGEAGVMEVELHARRIAMLCSEMWGKLEAARVYLLSRPAQVG